MRRNGHATKPCLYTRDDCRDHHSIVSLWYRFRNRRGSTNLTHRVSVVPTMVIMVFCVTSTTTSYLGRPKSRALVTRVSGLLARGMKVATKSYRRQKFQATLRTIANSSLTKGFIGSHGEAMARLEAGLRFPVPSR